MKLAALFFPGLFSFALLPFETEHPPVPLNSDDWPGMKRYLWQWRGSQMDKLTPMQANVMAEFIRKLITTIETTKSVPYMLDQLFNRKREFEMGRTNNYDSCGPSSECGQPFDFTAIWGYGCYCHFGEDAGKGQGKVQNSLDRLCKSLQMCYRCATIDSWEHDEICHPGSETYVVDMTKDFGGEGIMAECLRENNENVCKVHTCCCEVEFITSLIELFWQGYVFDNSLKHGPNWKWSDHCQADWEPHTSSCCGEYPQRRPYNMDKQECCIDEIIRPLNTCPQVGLQ